MAPTTLVGQKTSTSPYGRNQAKDGAPLKMAEFLAQLEGVAFSARVAVNNPRNLMDAKKQIRRAVRYQAEGKGFSFIEALSACPTNWGMSPLAANERVGSEMCDYFKLGVFKDTAQF